MNFRVVVAAVAGTIVLAVLEAVTYALLLPGFVDANRIDYPGLIKDPPASVPYALFNLVWASLLAVFFDKWAGIRTFAAGAWAGAVIMVVVVLGINLGYLAFFNLLKNSFVVIPVKLIAIAITGAFAGGLIAVILGRMKGQAPA